VKESKLSNPFTYANYFYEVQLFYEEYRPIYGNLFNITKITDKGKAII